MTTRRELRPRASKSETSVQRIVHDVSNMSLVPAAPLPLPVKLLPTGSKLPHIAKDDLTLLRQKQARLRATITAIEEEAPAGSIARNALASTLIFAHYEAGTAVCIDSTGLILTCCHCFGDTAKERRQNKHKWLLFYTGQAVLVESQIHDEKRDLALARIIAVEQDPAAGSHVDTAIDLDAEDLLTFPTMSLSPHAPALRAKIFCIGQPGQDNLESVEPQKVTYKLFEISEGNLCGMVKDCDPQDNSEIGALKHDAWTYWGHSGAPLVKKTDGTLVGLHSSWDDETAMRHGVPWWAIREFLDADGVQNA